MENRWQDFIDLSRRSNEIVPPKKLSDYEAILGFKREELENKSVLDLGAHKEETFAKDLENAGVHAFVTSLSPDFASKDGRKEKPKNAKITSVAALAEALPFKDESFDFILDLGGPSLYSTTAGDIRKRLEEEIRVLKHGGKSIFLIVNNELREKYEPFKNLLEWDKDLGEIKCTIEDLELPGYYRFIINKE